MNPPRRYLKGAWMGLLVAVGLVAYLCFHGQDQTKRQVVEPFEDSRQIISNIRALPKISNLIESEVHWEPYVTLAKRLMISDTNLIFSALDISARPKPASLDADVKVMLLLRVCFECPPNIKQPASYGGWISYSAQAAGRTNFDENWPVGSMSGHFHLLDNINGYLGKSYDPVAEFQWRLGNCEWRKLK